MKSFLLAAVILCWIGLGRSQTTTTTTTTTATTTTQTQTQLSATLTTSAPVSKKAQPTRSCTKSLWCYCDLSNLCELGCCCDPDCEPTVTDTFENACACDLPNDYAVPYCSTSDILVSNQTHLIKRSIGGLMCLVDDHVYRKESYAEGKTLSARQFTEQLKYLEAIGEFQRKQPPINGDDDSAHETGFREGDFIQVKLKSGVYENFGVPVSLGGDVCDTLASVQYLRARSSRCFFEFSCDNPFSKMEYFTNLAFVAQNSKTVEPLADICVPNRDCAPHSTQDLTLCSHISRIEYRIVHNGTLGVQDVYVFVYRDETLPSDGTMVLLQSDVFFETKQDAAVRLSGGLTHRSGNPGYLIGKPILAKNGESSTRPVSAPFKDCTDIEGGTVRFGQNVHTVCRYSSCDELKEFLPTMLTGDSPGYIGAYGSSDARVIDDWLVVDENTFVNINDSCACKVEVILAFKRTQFAFNPQNRIVYAQVRYSPLPGSQPLVEISVDFVDMSSRPEVKYAGPPIIDVKLPEDFFYPLHLEASSVRSQNILHNRIIVYICPLLLLRLLRALI